MPSNPGVATDVGEDVAITIPQGASTSDIAEILKEKNLIKSVFRFKLESKLNNYDGTFQQGNYTLKHKYDTSANYGIAPKKVEKQKKHIN